MTMAKEENRYTTTISGNRNAEAVNIIKKHRLWLRIIEVDDWSANDYNIKKLLLHYDDFWPSLYKSAWVDTSL